MRAGFRTAVSFILLIVCAGFAFADIISSGYSPVYGSLVSIVEAGDNKTAVLKTSLRECRDAERLIIDDKLTAAALSKYVPSYIIAGRNNGLALYGMLSGKADWLWDGSLSGPVKKISQDVSGEFISVTDGSTAALFRFGKNGLEHIFSKEFTGGITALLPDTERKALFVAEKSGVITVWSFSGSLVQTVDVGSPINDMVYDSKKNGLLAAAKNGLYFLRGDTLGISRLTFSGADSVSLDGFSGRLAAVSGTSAYFYDYPSMRLVCVIRNGFGKTADSGGAKFAGLYIKNYVRLFNVETGVHVATINVSEKGSFFLPPDRAIPGVNASLMDMITGGENTPIPDRRAVCAPVAAMVSGVYMPEKAFSPSPHTAEAARSPSVKKPVSPNMPGRIDIPEIPPVSEPFAEDTHFTSGVREPDEAFFESGVKAPFKPQVKPVEKPVLSAEMAPSSVPSWVANRKNLPPYNVTAGASDENEAVKNAKKQIKDAAAREMLKRLIDGKKADGIENTEVAKRFLWMTASSAANSLDSRIKTADRWKSPAGQSFVLCVLDPALIDGALDDAYKKEIEKISGMSAADYMAAKPNVID